MEDETIENSEAEALEDEDSVDKTIEEDEGDVVVDDDDNDDDSEDESEDESDEDDSQDEDLRKELEDYKSQLEQKRVEIAKLNSGAYKMRNEIKALKGKKEEDTTFTDAQITKILDEHRDDPAVLLQVFKQVAKQQTAGVKDDVVTATEIAQTKANLDNFLHDNWPELSDEKSQEFSQLQQAKQWMKIDDHPYGDFLSLGAVMLQRMPEMIEQAKKDGRAEALKEKSDSVRKKNVKGTKLSGKGKMSGKVVVTDEIKTTAAEIGITDKKQLALYAKILKNAGKGQNSMSVGG